MQPSFPERTTTGFPSKSGRKTRSQETKKLLQSISPMYDIANQYTSLVCLGLSVHPSYESLLIPFTEKTTLDVDFFASMAIDYYSSLQIS